MSTAKNLLVSLFLLPGLISSAKSDPINKLLGDKSYQEKFGHAPSPAAGEKERIQTHLEYVEAILKNVKDSGQWTQQQYNNRQKLIGLLHEYRLAGKFPVNYDMPVRRPCFQDKDGNICAVGYLVQQTAGQEMVDKINARYKYGYIEEMQVPELEQWITASGLSKEECAMIQPTYGPTHMLPVYADGGRQGFRDYLSREISLDRYTVDSVQVNFTVDTSGSIKNLKITGKENLRLQVKKAIEKVRFTPGGWSGWHVENGRRVEETSLSYTLVFNLPKDSSHYPQLICYDGVKKADTTKKKINISGTFSGFQLYGLYGGKVRVFKSGREVWKDGGHSGGISNAGSMQFSVPKDSLRAETFDLEIEYPAYRKIIIRNIAYNDHDFKLKLEPRPQEIEWSDRINDNTIDQMGTRFPIRTSKK